MILGRQLTAQERRRSQHLYCAFNFVNGMSYMCLGESLLVLFAAQLGAPNAVVALLGAMQYIGYAMLPLGVRRTSRRGAAASQADFWIARNVAALITASAGPVWLFSPPAAWALLLLGALLFYGFRAAGCVLFTPLLGDVSTEEEAPGVIGTTTAFFNVSAVVTLAAITVATHRWHGREALAAIIVIGAMLGMGSSFFVRGMRETGAIRDAARAPLWHGMIQSFRNADLQRLVIAWFFLNLVVIMLVPISMLALKRGCGFDDGKALWVDGVDWAHAPVTLSLGPDGLVFTTGGDSEWALDATTGWTNGVSAKSGVVTSGQSSWVETTVTGDGTLAFRWKVMGGIYRNNPFAYAKVEVDGTQVASTHLTDGWEGQTLMVEGAETHTIRWTYLRTSARSAEGDCAWLDGVSWESKAAEAVVVDGVEVPASWLEEEAAPIVAANGGSLEEAAAALAANGVNTVAECYVAGISPTNATQVFRTVIS